MMQVGRICGHVTTVKHLHVLAPSTTAASSRLRGTDCSAASIYMRTSGNSFHTFTIIAEVSASCLLPVQASACLIRPRRSRISLRIPKSEWYIHFQTMLPITDGKTHASMIRQRQIPRNRIRSCEMTSAQIKPIRNWKNTLTTVQITVFFSALRNVSLVSNFLYCARPTNDQFIS